MKINTTPGETYIVLSTGGCTVTTGAGKQIKKLAAGQDFFTAMTGDSILSDDNASVTVAKGEILSLLNTDGTGEDVQATLRFQPVTSQSALPATGENGVIYLVPNGKTAPNQYTEWVWTGAAYEQLGDVGVDLSGYAKKSELATDVQQAFSNRTFEVYRLSVNSGGASIDGLTIFNPMGGPGSKLTADDGIVQNSESFSNQHLVIHTDAMVQGGLNAKRVITAELALPAAAKITMGEGSTIEGPGWDETIAQGEPVSTVSTSTVTIRHATWFDNTTQSSIAVQPGTWKNRVMTCYLKTSMPVSLSGVTWLYGEPTMTAGYTYVIALQQIDAAIVLANLAYTLKQ
jgi:hypothetical protein